MKNVPEMLIEASNLYKERNALYGDNYKRFGPALHSLISSVKIDNPDDFNRFALLTQIFSKMSRYCQLFAEGGHDDSLDDMAVYAMMLKELDASNKNTRVQRNIDAAIETVEEAVAEVVGEMSLPQTEPSDLGFFKKRNSK
jgi:hypothetical protein